MPFNESIGSRTFNPHSTHSNIVVLTKCYEVTTRKSTSIIIEQLNKDTQCLKIFCNIAFFFDLTAHETPYGVT